MSGTCVIGLQWGDEAKGKLVDLLTEQHDIVVRYQGGANAGHTVVVGPETYKLSLIPSGILSKDVKCIISGGVVLNPATILQEIAMLTERGILAGENLLISDRAHVIFPWHAAEDRAFDESTADGENIGTTLRGIGPCYRDKVGRSYAIRLGDMYRDSFPERIERIVEFKNQALSSLCPDGFTPLNAAAILEEYEQYAEQLRPHVADTTSLLLSAIDRDQAILFEGAQGSLLDVDHGTYPFVTSSNSSGVGIAAGAGVPPRFVQRAIGVVKAYATRVGGGPFPTELDDAIGQQLRDQGNEYGTVTKRPRRCGWFDAVAARYTARVGGIDEIAVMLLDVLSGLPELKICTAYEVHGERVTDFPSHVEDLREAIPIFETLPSWQEDITAAREMADLPSEARAYVSRLGELLERPVSFVSVGPDREQTIFANRPTEVPVA